jgi:hypothetical protein
LIGIIHSVIVVQGTMICSYTDLAGNVRTLSVLEERSTTVGYMIWKMRKGFSTVETKGTMVGCLTGKVMVIFKCSKGTLVCSSRRQDESISMVSSVSLDVGPRRECWSSIGEVRLVV